MPHIIQPIFGEVVPQLLTAISEAATDVAMSTATGFNPLLRSPAQTHVLEFNCLLLLHFHLQFSNTNTFQTL
jgi:hypothetical protein